MSASDSVRRAITDDGSFRVITLNTTQTAREILARHHPPEQVNPLLAELVTAAVMIRETMSPDQRVQLMLKEETGITLVVETFPDGMTRALMSAPEGADSLWLGPDTRLSVSRVLFSKDLHQGVVETNAEGGLSASLSGYFLQSEQVPTILALASRFDDQGELVLSGGFLVQLLPEATLDALAPLVAKMEQWENFTEIFAGFGGDTQTLMEEVLADFKHHHLSTSDVFWGCQCDEQRLIAAMTTLGEDELRKVISSGEVLEVECDYCRRVYHLGAQQLKPLLYKT